MHTKTRGAEIRGYLTQINLVTCVRSKTFGCKYAVSSLPVNINVGIMRGTFSIGSHDSHPYTWTNGYKFIVNSAYFSLLIGLITYSWSCTGLWNMFIIDQVLISAKESDNSVWTSWDYRIESGNSDLEWCHKKPKINICENKLVYIVMYGCTDCVLFCIFKCVLSVDLHGG